MSSKDQKVDLRILPSSSSDLDEVLTHRTTMGIGSAAKSIGEFDQALTRAKRLYRYRLLKGYETTVRTNERFPVFACGPEAFRKALHLTGLNANQTYEAITHGVPIGELRKSRCSVQFLRKPSRKSRAISIGVSPLKVRSNAEEATREAEKFIARVKSVAPAREKGRRGAATPRRRESPPPQTSRSGG